MNRLVNAQVTNRRWAFFSSPRYRTFEKPNTRLMTPIVCSTLARTLDFVRFLARSTSSTTPRCRVRRLVKSLAAGACW